VKIFVWRRPRQENKGQEPNGPIGDVSKPKKQTHIISIVNQQWKMTRTFQENLAGLFHFLKNTISIIYTNCEQIISLSGVAATIKIVSNNTCVIQEIALKEWNILNWQP